MGIWGRLNFLGPKWVGIKQDWGIYRSCLGGTLHLSLWDTCSRVRPRWDSIVGLSEFSCPHPSNQRSKETQALDAVGSLELDASCSSHKIHLFRCWAIDLIMLTIALKRIHMLGCLQSKSYRICLYLGTHRYKSFLQVKIQSCQSEWQQEIWGKSNK